jgi:hypothetical protein
VKTHENKGEALYPTNQAGKGKIGEKYALV